MVFHAFRAFCGPADRTGNPSGAENDEELEFQQHLNLKGIDSPFHFPPSRDGLGELIFF